MTKRQEKLVWIGLAVMWAFGGWTLLRAILYGVLPRRYGGGEFTFAESPNAFVFFTVILTVFFVGVSTLAVVAWKGDRQVASNLRRWRPPLDNAVRKSEDEQ